MEEIIGNPIYQVNRNSEPLPHDNIGMSIGSRIREARRAAKLTQKALAQKVGMGQASLSELETGESQGTTMVASFAAALGVNALWLETGKGTMHGEHPSQVDEAPFIENNSLFPGALRVVVGDEPDTVAVPRVRLRLRAGVAQFDTEPDMNGDGHEQMPRTVLTALRLDPRNLLAVRVRGMSMEPMLFEDDVVIIDTSDVKPISREIYAVNFNGEPCIKQLLYRGGQWYLHSINPDHEPVNVRSGQCSLVGRVVYQPGRVVTGRL
ncbi:XRE family transcriptional regulator [Massilia sp. YIM B02443]|uniref:XRE family transcriptional regulator n=1 Tax=Massilia sp. YIM B02443 TaxID=3050127 RepID=UPI0025B679D8|nr:S24 family peptidase [Massilia sp. YIM B02443]MDN4036783.1 S24 family peptidase [Massilia sp. YIM B02443]